MGDIKEVLTKLLPLVDVSEKKEWIKMLKIFKESSKKKCFNGENTPEKLFDSLNNLLDEDAIIVTDVGQHQMWTALNYKFKKPRKSL